MISNIRYIYALAMLCLFLTTKGQEVVIKSPNSGGWNGGYNTHVQITPLQDISNWQVVIDLGPTGSVTNLWNGTYTVNGSQVTIDAESFNASVTAGTTIEVGMGITDPSHTSGSTFPVTVTSYILTPSGGGAGGPTSLSQYWIEESGTVKLNTTAYNDLNIPADARIEGQLHVGENSLVLEGMTSNPSSVNGIYGDDADLQIQSQAGNTFNTLMNVNGGNVGVGVANPSQKMEVGGGLISGIYNPSTTNFSGGMMLHTHPTVFNGYIGNARWESSIQSFYALMQTAAGATFVNARKESDISFRFSNLPSVMVLSPTNEGAGLGHTANVGIGTASPNERLDVLGNVKVQGSLLLSEDGTYQSTIAAVYNNFSGFNADDIHIKSATGQVRINTPGKNNTLHLYAIDGVSRTTVNSNGLSYWNSNEYDYRFLGNGGDSYLKNGRFAIGHATPTEALDVVGNIKSDGLRINTSVTPGGFVAIGTAEGTGTTTPYDMVVNGHLGVHKLRVDINDVWGDFVFDQDYALMSLEELEQFIDKNKHLPAIPSAEAIAESGVDMGEMVRQQMIKIEELTLHVIELNKKVEELQTK